MSDQLYHPVTIANLTIGGNIFLAPLAGYTDVPFRTLAKEGGADLTFTEMVSVEGLSREGEKTITLLERSPLEEQYAVQLFLSSTESLPRALDLLAPFAPSMIDINCGCPVPKVTKTGAGCAMMGNPSLITETVRIIKERTGLPVSVKLRIGWDQASRSYLAFSQAALDGGADLLTLHARTRSQGYAPFAEWETLSNVRPRRHREPHHLLPSEGHPLWRRASHPIEGGDPDPDHAPPRFDDRARRRNGGLQGDAQARRRLSEGDCGKLGHQAALGAGGETRRVRESPC